MTIYNSTDSMTIRNGMENVNSKTRLFSFYITGDFFTYNILNLAMQAK